MRNKWKRKSLAMLLALCMVFTMTPAAFAADDGGGSQTLQTDVSDGAQSNEENALQAQIDSAESGATITLSEDTTVASLTIPEDKNITLDLGGNNLTLSGGVAVTDTAYESGTFAALMNSGTLSIVNGTLTGTGTACLIINRDTLNLGSDLTLSKSGAGNAIDNLGGTVTSAANITVTSNGYTAIVTYGGDVVVNSGTINALAADVASENGQKENYGISVFNREYDNESAGASVTINGGSITTDAYVLSTNNIKSGGSNPSNVAINAGAFVSNNRTAVYWPSAGTLTVGTVGGDNAAVSITAEKGSAIEVCSGTLAVNSGTLKGSDSNDALNASSDMAAAYRANSGCAGIGDAVSIIARRGSGYDTAALNVAINGGSFSSSDNYAVRYFDCNQVANAKQIDQDVDVAIKGGTFTFTGSTQGSAIDASVVADDDKKFISGGTFSHDVSGYVATGYSCTGSGSNYVVAESEKGAMTVAPETTDSGEVSASLEGIYKSDDTVITGSGENQPSGSNKNGEVAIDLTMATSTNDTKATLNVAEDTAQSLGNAEGLTVATNVGTVQLNAVTLDKVAQTTNDVAITIEKKTTSDSSAKVLYTVEVKSGDKNLLPESAADNGTVTITVAKPANVEDLQAWYVVGDPDKLVYVEKLNTADAEDGKIAININHLSTIALTNGTPDAQEAAVVTDSNGAVTGRYATLNDAINNVLNGDTITIQRDIPNATGISVESGKNFTLDFAGHTYTLTGPGAGSTNTETNGFQLLEDSTIVFKNGTIRIAENANNIKRIIQSYADVTFENMNFYAENQVGGEDLALSFNNGDVTFTGDTNVYVTNPEKTTAFDTYFWSSSYPDGVSVTFDKDYTGTIEGTILYDSMDAAKGKLTIAGNGGTFTKIAPSTTAGVDAAANTGISISGGKYANPLEPEWLEGLNTELHSQQSGLYSYYTSVDTALAAAEPGDEVTVLNASGTVATSDVTIKYGNGSEDLTLTVNNGTEITLPAAPSRDGYTFDGWIVNGERYAAKAKVTINADTIIYADWEPPYTGKYSYEVFTSVGDNGTISVDRYATEGDKVTIEVAPDEAYLLDELVVTANGKEVALTDNGDGTYTFTMPSADVKISATFAEDPDWTEPEEPATDVSDIFIDVAPNAWYKDAVQYAYDNGLMTGVSANEFAPDATTTRGMIVSMLARLEGVESANDAGFADVEGEWYATAVNWAASVGVVNGYEDNTFRPNDAITREQLAAILMNYAAYKGEDVSARASLDAYSDAENVSTWATDTMSWAVAEGYITGMTADTLQPQGSATRAQVAAILERFLAE